MAVIGGHKCDIKVDEMAHKLGNLLAKMGVILVCGGLGGVMKSVSKGMRDFGGITVGVLPGEDKNQASEQ